MVRRSFHSVVEIPVGDLVAGRSVPALFLIDGGLSLYCLSWARDMMVTENMSPMHLSKAVEATGLFYDYYTGVYKSKNLVANELQGLLRNFFEARAYGCVELGWLPVGRKTAKYDVRYASAFSEFCAKNFGTLSINPVEKKLITALNFAEQMQHHANLKHRQTWDMLYHLIPSTQQGQGIKTNFAFNPVIGRGQRRSSVKYFPPEKILDLINATDNLRDKLAFLLLFFGGLRLSEPLHIYVNDITTPDGEAKIKIAHPESSNYSWNAPFIGNQTGQRSRFLLERYQLCPRNKLGLKNPFHAGWKGVLHTENTDEGGFYWLLPGIGNLFAKLHRQYLHEFRAKIDDKHPYYFVNLNEDQYGTPLKISNLTKSFYRAAKRVGLSASDPGVNPHGARHFYGYFCASFLKLPIDKTQYMMRHAKIRSTQVYYTIDERVVRTELQKAHERLNSDLPEFIKKLDKLAKNEH